MSEKRELRNPETKRRIRGPNTKEHIKEDILLLKKNDVGGKLSVRAIREQLLKMHPGSKYIPKERAIYNVIQKNKETVIFNPIDSPWSIGSCEKYNIPADIISNLIAFEQLGGHFKFTIRYAKWFARLKPVVFEMSAAKRPLEDALSGVKLMRAPENDSRLNLLAIITLQYAGHEQLSELRGELYPDTSHLDTTIFTKGDIGADERGEPIYVDEDDFNPAFAFKSRFQTNTFIIKSKKEKK